MKKLYFIKMQWTWNDFIIINYDDLKKINIRLTKKFILKICSRHFWIWADWVLYIFRGNNSELNYEMYNSDWTKVDIWGTGIWCYMKYLVSKGIISESVFGEKTKEKLSKLSIDWDFITVDMWKPSKIKNLIYKSKDLWDRFPLKIDNEEFIFTPVSMWNPHSVIFFKESNLLCELVNKTDISNFWRKIENRIDIFPDKTNVEFVRIISDKELNMRIWERWAGETLSCWSCASAVVVAWVLAWKLLKDTFIKVNLLWWVLEIKWSWELNKSVILKWEVKEVFEWHYYVR